MPALREVFYYQNLISIKHLFSPKSMRKLITTALLFAALGSMAQSKPDTINIYNKKPDFEIDPAIFIHTCQLIVSIGDEMVCMNYVDRKLTCDTPFTAIKHNHAIIIFKHGKKIGAFTYYKKPFELTDLHLQ